MNYQISDIFENGILSKDDKLSNKSSNMIVEALSNPIEIEIQVESVDEDEDDEKCFEYNTEDFVINKGFNTFSNQNEPSEDDQYSEMNSTFEIQQDHINSEEIELSSPIVNLFITNIDFIRKKRRKEIEKK